MMGLIVPHMENGYVLVPEGSGASVAEELPRGVVRVGDAVLAAERLIAASGELHASDEFGDRGDRGGAEDFRAGCRVSGELAKPDASCVLGMLTSQGIQSDQTGAREPVRIAAFDFDGTTLSGNSPVMLVRYLIGKGMLSKSVLARIIMWGIAYKTRLPQNESWVRGLVFTAFRDRPVAQVNEFLREFYRSHVSPRIRQQAVQAMQDHLSAGHVVVCVSATFEPIIAAAMVEHPIQYAIATRMKVDAYGCYTSQVEGLPVEGAEKLAALTSFADARFGEGNWELGWAYGDHHSDRTLLGAAAHAFAVTPDRPLSRTARELGYDVLDWDS